jgi:signal transduction histidine kinase
MAAIDIEGEASGPPELAPTVLDALPAQIAVLDGRGVITAVSRGWREFARRVGGGGRNHGLGRPYVPFLQPAVIDGEPLALDEAVRAALAAPTPRARTFALRLRDGEARTYRIQFTPVRRDGRRLILATHEDVTELTRARDALRDATERLFSLQEEERRRLAADLHDSTGQHLLAVALGLARLRDLVDRPEALTVLDEVTRSVEEAGADVRVVSYLLYPPDLDHEGLASALHAFVGGFGRRTGLRARFTVEGRLERRVPAAETALFRVVQEALSNVHRHARANAVEVALLCRPDALILRVTDDGRGLTEGDRDAAGVGIRAMQARIRQLGGELAVTGGPTGTVVKAELPLPLGP